MVKKKKKLGRPSKYADIMKRQADILAAFKEGQSLIEVAALLGISRDTIHEWCKDPNKKVFSDTIKAGIELSEAWWECQGRTNLINEYQGPSFNSTLWYMNMKNRFGWKDRHDVAMTGTINVHCDSDDENL
jgi:hypothetical protein